MAVSRRTFLKDSTWAGTGLLVTCAAEPDRLLAAFGATKLPPYLPGQRIAATPATDYRAYRSKPATNSDSLTWVQVDLQKRKPIEAVLLYPACERMFPGRDQFYRGEGFPLRFKMEPRAARFNLHVRIPSWAVTEMAISVNGRPVGKGQPESYVPIDREWTDGDRVEFTLPIGFRATRYTGADQIPGRARYAFDYGPILYAAVGSEKPELPSGFRPETMAGELEALSDAAMQYRFRGNPHAGSDAVLASLDAVVHVLPDGHRQ